MADFVGWGAKESTWQTTPTTLDPGVYTGVIKETLDGKAIGLAESDVQVDFEPEGLSLTMARPGGDKDTGDANILVERQGGEWVVYVHPTGNDPEFVLRFKDNGTCGLEKSHAKPCRRATSFA